VIWTIPCEVGMRSWAPWMPCTSWPEARMNWGIAAGCGAASSWGKAVADCAADVRRFPTECAGDPPAQLVGSEPKRNRIYWSLKFSYEYWTSSSHNTDCEECDLLGCNTMKFGASEMAFEGTNCLQLLGHRVSHPRNQMPPTFRILAWLILCSQK
jgi:hypothetical protein